MPQQWGQEGLWRWRGGALFFFCLVGLAPVSIAVASLNKDGLPLPMSFEASSRVTILFEWWDAATLPLYALSCACCVVLGYVSIALKVLRHTCDMRLALEEAQGKPRLLLLGSIPVASNAVRALNAFLNYAWDSVLMLVAMTFNVGVFVSLMAGIALGFLTIGHCLDQVPSTPQVSASCECNEQFSCGCHRGQPCACYKTANLVDAETDKQIKKDAAGFAAQPGMAFTAASCHLRGPSFLMHSDEFLLADTSSPPSFWTDKLLACFPTGSPDFFVVFVSLEGYSSSATITWSDAAAVGLPSFSYSPRTPN
ncbi:hypothetical protein Esti_002051 [Eimeria stiedai]